MTGPGVPPLDGEVVEYMDRILAQAREQAAGVVSTASHRAARRMARAHGDAPAAMAEHCSAQAEVLGRLIVTAEAALREERDRIGDCLADMERRDMNRLSNVHGRLDEMVAARASETERPLALVANPVSPIRPLRVVGNKDDRPESAAFAQLRRLLQPDSLADPA